MRLWFVQTSYTLHPGKGPRNRSQIHLVPAEDEAEAATFHRGFLVKANGRYTAEWGPTIVGPSEPMPSDFVWKGAAAPTFKSMPPQ